MQAQNMLFQLVTLHRPCIQLFYVQEKIKKESLFAATANSVRYNNGEVWFADIDPDSYLISIQSIRDLIESKQFGTEYIIAPMVETNYALQKYILAVNKVYSKDQQKSTDFLYNVETIDTYNALNEMSETAKNASEVQGMVFGRVD